MRVRCRTAAAAAAAADEVGIRARLASDHHYLGYSLDCRRTGSLGRGTCNRPDDVEFLSRAFFFFNIVLRIEVRDGSGSRVSYDEAALTGGCAGGRARLGFKESGT